MTATHICPCTNLRLSHGGEQFFDSNIRVMHIRFECVGCGQRFRALGVHDGMSIDAPSTRDGGETLMMPIVPVGEEPTWTRGRCCHD
jgi:hypothetical protein